MDFSISALKKPSSLQPRDRQTLGLPSAAAHLARQLSNPNHSSTNNAVPPPSAVDIMSQLRREMGKGNVDSEQGQALLELLDAGWYAKKEKKKREPRSVDSPAAAANSSSNPISPAAPRLRPLNLDSLREPAGAPPGSPSMFSSYSMAGTSNWDTPRSWATAATTCLPQTTAELDGLDEEQLHKLAEEADKLAKRAETALRLARARLEATTEGGGYFAGNGAEGAPQAAAAGVAGQLIFLVLALLTGWLTLLEIALRVVGFKKGAELLQGAYTGLGAVAGAAQGAAVAVFRRNQ